MINYKNISKAYNNITNAVDSLNLEIPDGKIIGLIGHNGAGKTTTIKMTVGILEPTEGEILINGKNILKDSIDVKREIGFAPDNGFITEVFTGYEYLNFIADIYEIPSDVRKDRIITLSEKLEISNDLNKQIRSYSKGMKQKIVIIASLIHNPKIWILDEPLNGLDPQSAFTLKNLMKEYASLGNTVIFSTHILEVAEKICDEILILNKSKLIFKGTLDDLKTNYPKHYTLEDIFLKLTNTLKAN